VNILLPEIRAGSGKNPRSKAKVIRCLGTVRSLLITSAIVINSVVINAVIFAPFVFVSDGFYFPAEEDASLLSSKQPANFFAKLRRLEKI
jgi:hypothetical protein